MVAVSENPYMVDNSKDVERSRSTRDKGKTFWGDENVTEVVLPYPAKSKSSTDHLDSSNSIDFALFQLS